jgi:hypothetical protein
VGQEGRLDLQGGDLVAAGLDNIHTAAPENAIEAVFLHGQVAGQEPAIPKRFLRFLRLAPIFQTL